MKLLGDVHHGESCFGPFEDGVSVGARQVHGLRQTYYSISNRFGRTRLYSEVTWHKWNLVLVRLEVVLILMQYRCIVYAKRTIGSAIISDAPDGTPR
jgi:hypothetical protein